jgi:hypothetical protein
MQTPKKGNPFAKKAMMGKSKDMPMGKGASIKSKLKMRKGKK